MFGSWLLGLIGTLVGIGSGLLTLAGFFIGAGRGALIVGIVLIFVASFLKYLSKQSVRVKH